MTHGFDPDPVWDRLMYEEARLDAEAAEAVDADVETDWAICPTCQGNSCAECNFSGEIFVPVETEEV